MFKTFTSLTALAAAFCVLGAAAVLADEEILTPKLVFVTTGAFDGNLGGLIGADEKCQEAADNAGLDGDFQAWLSDSNDTPTSRFETLALGPYFMLDGRIVAENFADLLDGNLRQPIEITELGVQQSANEVWTGTVEDGTASVFNCTNWTSSSGAVFGLRGLVGEVDDDWTFRKAFGGKADCEGVRFLYCFQQER